MSAILLFRCLAPSLMVLGLSSCWRGKGHHPDRAREAPLTILYTCDTQGAIFPLECDGASEGGLARRERYVRGVEPGRRLLVDAGDFSAGAGDPGATNALFILAAYERMGYAAINLGHREAGLDRETINDLCRRDGHVISANLVDAAGQPVAAPVATAVLEDGTAVGIIGVMDDSLARDKLGAGLALLPPDTALGRYLPELRKRSDVVVLLAFTDTETLLNLASLFPEIDIAIGGRVDRSTPDVLRLGHAAGVAVTGQGRRIGRLELAFSGGAVAARTNAIVTLSRPTPDETGAAGARRAYEKALRARAEARGGKEASP